MNTTQNTNTGTNAGTDAGDYGNYALKATATAIATVALTLATVMLLAPTTATAKPISINVTSIIYVTDGDTFAITTDTVHKVLVGKRFTVRINGIDAPEIKGRCPKERSYAKQAKQLLTNMLNNATANNANVEVVSLYKDTFGRLVGDVYIHPKKGQGGEVVDVGKVMLSEGLALPYSTKGRKNNYDNFWCS